MIEHIMLTSSTFFYKNPLFVFLVNKNTQEPIMTAKNNNIKLIISIFSIFNLLYF